MRTAVAVLAALTCVTGILAQETKIAPRFQVEADLKTYPQGSAKEAFASVLKAIDNKRHDYLLAHLADAKYVDDRVAAAGGRFAEVLRETKGWLGESTVKQLRRFLKEGDWQIEDQTATVRVKDVNDRRVHLRKIDGRWFFENRWKPTTEAKEK